MTVLASVPVEQIRIGDRIKVSQRVGIRPVVDVLDYDTLGVEEVDCFVVLYQPIGPGQAWENRSGMKGVLSHVRRDVASIRPLRRGDLVEVERLRLVERS